MPAAVGTNQYLVLARIRGLKKLLRDKVGAKEDDKRTMYELAAALGIHTKEEPILQIALQTLDDVLLVGLDGGRRA